MKLEGWNIRNANMPLKVIDRNEIHDLQEAGILPGNPGDPKISKIIQNQYLILKHELQRIKCDLKIARRPLRRSLKCLLELMPILFNESLHMKEQNLIVKKVLKELEQGKIDPQDLHYLLPQTLMALKKAYSHLSKEEKQKCHLDAEGFKKALQAASGGWETERDRNVQFVLASFLLLFEGKKAGN
jgi:hypothetical protein